MPSLLYPFLSLTFNYIIIICLIFTVLLIGSEWGVLFSKRDAKIHFLISCKVFPTYLPPFSPISIFLYFTSICALGVKKQLTPMLVNKPKNILYFCIVKDELSLASHMHWLVNSFPEKNILNWNIHVFQSIYINITERGKNGGGGLAYCIIEKCCA